MRISGVNWLDVTDHGGECCGIFHISDFSTSERVLVEDVVKLLTEFRVDQEVLNEEYNVKEGKLLEVVLTDSQIKDMPLVVKELKRYGFKCVSRFKNNTGTFCNVLHYVPEDLLEGSPF